MHFVAAIAATALTTAAGYAVQILLCRWMSAPRNPLWDIALSYPLGTAAIAFIQFGMVLCHIPVSRDNLLFFITPLLAGAAYVMRREIAARCGALKWSNRAISRILNTPRRASFSDSYSNAGLVAVLGCLTVIIICACVFLPAYTWDARGTWLLNAKIFYFHKTAFNNDFLDPYRFITHHNYPWLMPLTINFVFALMGGMDDFIGKIPHACFYISYLLIFYAAQKTIFRLTRTQSLLFTAVAGSLPAYYVLINGSVPSAYADFPLSCLYFAAVLCLMKYFIGREPRDAATAGIFAAACIFTKNEGSVLFIFMLFLIAAQMTSDQTLRTRTVIRNLGFFMLTPVIVGAAWYMVKRTFPAIDDLNPAPFFTWRNFLDSTGNFVVLYKMTLWQMTGNLKSWGVFWYMLAAAVVMNVHNRQDRPARVMEYFLLFMPLVYYFFVLTPIVALYALHQQWPLLVLSLKDEYGFDGPNFERMRMHALPLLMLFISIRFSRIFDQKEHLRGSSSVVEQ